jgi:thioredoxin reductase
MEQQISMVYLNERMPFPRYFTPSDLRLIVGEKYRSAEELIVLEKAGDEVTVITSEEDSLCVEELRKLFLRNKKISVRVTDKGELHKLLKKICNFFGFMH